MSSLPTHDRPTPAARGVGAVATSGCGTIPDPGPGEVLTRTLWLWLDTLYSWPAERPPLLHPTGRDQRNDDRRDYWRSHSPPRIRASQHRARSSAKSPGGWASHLVTHGPDWCRCRHGMAATSRSQPVSTLLRTCTTQAYSAMKDIGQPKAGETVLISAASGAVPARGPDHQTGPRARRLVSRAIPISRCWCRRFWSSKQFRRSSRREMDMDAALRDACPNGINVYFENVASSTNVQEARLSACSITFSAAEFN